MKRLLQCAVLGLLPLAASAAQPWQEITMPTTAEAVATFANPPKEYGAIHWAIWGGQQSKDRIIADIDHIAANGGGVYMINNSRGVLPKYLSPEYMDLVKAVVSECKKNGMKVWIETDCGYPDGFAGGMISRDYPLLGMQGIIPDAHCTVAAGATLDIPLPSDTLGILANARAAAADPAGGQAMPIPADGVFKYTVPRRGGGQLIVQLPAAEVRYTLTPGEPFSIAVPAGTKSISLAAGGAGGGGGARGARGGGGGGTVIPLPADGHLKWTAPAGNGSWDITFIRHIYRSSPTRNDNGDDAGATKDGYYSLIDYLDPEATATFIKLIHETYAKAVGDEFGKTVLGFRGDEPDYTGLIPWTPKLLETFEKQKGYDLKPYIVDLFGGGAAAEAQRVRADYYDVWSGIFQNSFYKPQQDWCRDRGMDYMVHINHEETMMALVNSEGSFFRCMRYVGVPGIDNLNQIGPGIVADFPKLATSASHLFGRAQVWEEEGGNVGVPGKFVFDYQLVRGVNYMNIRGMNAANAAPANPDPTFGTGWYYSRAQHLMAIGRPAAQVALYHPTDSYWMGDREADTANVKLVSQLMEQQVDFDHIDEDALASVCTLEGGTLKNLSGQVYRAVVMPSCSVIEKRVLDRLRAFAAGGGKVVFVGRTPALVVDRSFLHPEPGAPDLSFATLEPTEAITAKVIAALPKPDAKLDAPAPAVKYIHRKLKDGDVYFFFNESAQAQARTATIDGTGQVQIWDAITGKIRPLADAAEAKGSAVVPLALAAHEGRFIVIGPPVAVEPK